MVSKKTIILIVVITVVLIGIILGLALGLRKNEDNKGDDVEIINSYNNTDELIKKFPVLNPVTVQEGIEKKIQNRLLTGFENWNRGYKAWKKWGDILYTNASIYNVQGARLTLSQYQAAMDVSLKQSQILLGDFHNMIINGNYTAIFYDDAHVVNGKITNGTVSEFVVFKDYGGELGTRVVEGWGGAKGAGCDNMRKFQGEHERMVQDKIDLLTMNYQIPTTGTLREKYPIQYPTEYLDNEKANKFIDIILEGFDKWNTDIESYNNWLSKGYTEDALSYGINGEERNMKTYKDAMIQFVEDKKVIKLYFDNILIRDNWAALHYRYRFEYRANNEKYVGDRMQFLKFKEVETGKYKIEASWTK